MNGDLSCQITDLDSARFLNITFDNIQIATDLFEYNVLCSDLIAFENYDVLVPDSCEHDRYSVKTS